LMILLCSSIVFGQDKTDEKVDKTLPETLTLPNVRRNLRPQLTLQEAMKLMDKFIEKNKIKTSKYWFSSARMIQYGPENQKKQPVWFFEWMNESGIIGDYLHILVSMDGAVWQMPTM
jgi:hypothetical protein